MLDRFIFGNKQIPDMYFGNSAVAKIYLGDTLIWEKDSKVLVAGNNSVAIQYIPAADIAVSDIGIFTTSNDNSDAKIKVFHESGLCVAAYDGDVRTRNSELYELSGTKRDGVISTITLYAGQKYFIVYYVYDVYPAYFQNKESQTIANKIYENNTAASQTTIHNISENAQVLKPSLFAGVLRDTPGIFYLAENAWFTWLGATNVGMIQGQIYRRTSTGIGWTFCGIVGDQTSWYHTITTADLSNLLAKPIHGNFIWYIDGITGMNRNEIWGKPYNWESPVLVDLTQYSDVNAQLAGMLLTLSNTSVSKAMISNGTLFHGTCQISDSIAVKSGYRSKVTSTTPLSTLPSSPVNGDLYYLSGSIGAAIGHQTAVFAYNDGNYTQIYMENLSTYLDIIGLSTLLTKIGNNSDLVEYIQDTKGDESFLNSNTDNRKYYLKINGNEV